MKKSSLAPWQMGFYLISISIIIIFYVYFTEIYLEPQKAYGQTYKHILIEFSDTCLSLQKLGDYDTCGNPELIKAMFPTVKLKQTYQSMFENAEQTDALPYQQNNIVLNHKLFCIMENYCNVFDMKNSLSLVYWYDSDSKLRSYYDSIITINSNLLHKNLNTPEDIIQDDGTKRKIDFDANQINIKYCKFVTFDPYDIGLELGSLIWYLSDNCKDEKKLGYLSEPFVYNLNKTQVGDLSDSYAWSWLHNQTAIKEKYKGYMIGKDQ